jgi:hypothetical protein
VTNSSTTIVDRVPMMPVTWPVSSSVVHAGTAPIGSVAS